MRRLQPLQLTLLAVTLGAPLLLPPWSALALLALLLYWLARRPPRREVGIAGVAFLVAIVALAWGWWAERGAGVSERQWTAAARQEYAALWRDLRREAHLAAGAVGRPSQTAEGRLTAFRRLAALEERRPRDGSGRRALLLLDPDGAAVAWAGEGLLHELRPEEVPRSGSHFVAGWSAVSLLAVEPLDAARRPWRVAAGASFPTRELPFGRRAARSWSVVHEGAEEREAAPGALRVAVRGAPTLVVARRSESGPEAAAAVPPGLFGAPDGHALPGTPAAVRSQSRRLAWAALGFALLALAVLRGVVVALPLAATGATTLPDGMSASFAPLAVGGAVAWGAAAGAPPFALAALAGGLALAGLGLAGRLPGAGRWALAAKGAAAVVLLAGLAWACQAGRAPIDLAGGILASPEAFSLRLALAAAAFGLLAFAGLRRREEPPPAEPADLAAGASQGDRWAWLAVALLLLGAVSTDYPWAALLPLAGGGAAAALWVDRRQPRREGLVLATLAALAILAAAGTAEAAYRLRLDSYTRNELVQRFAPPTAREVASLAADLRRHFATLDLSTIAPRDPQGLERQDLAFALWRGSPLARRSTLSALILEPREGPASSFSFGLPLATDSSPAHWDGLKLPLWQGSLIAAKVTLLYQGRPWATARYWLLPRPGFQVEDQRGLGEVEVGLLKGGPQADPLEDLPRPARYALYTPEGRAALSPWEESPPLDPDLKRAAIAARTESNRAAIAAQSTARANGGQARVGPWNVETPNGPARAYLRAVPGGFEVVYVPFALPPWALERAGNFAVGVGMLLALAALLGLLLALPRAAFRDLLRRAVRSYSKRLLIVYTVLLLLPLLLLNAALVKTMDDRLQREQRAAGEAALNSAQKALGDYMLGLDPGFGIDTALNDPALASVSQIVRHEVNLYWGSSVYASSKHELFTAGLLPKRIPGEIYSRLVLLGYDLSSRTNRVGGTEYLELYAPLRVPGVPQSEERLFLSMPLLAQQAEGARDLAHLRRHGLLVTAALFVLLIAVGTRLARNFTRPLAQLVEGTRRIAAGAPSLDLKPTELELAALVEAVDQMAHKIAEGRERLLREKQVVERMVESITSGVVSVDREGRVLLHNRVAAELLGVEVGQSLERTVAKEPRLQPVVAFLRAAGGEMARSTVSLPGPDGPDGPEGEVREWTLLSVPVPGEGEPAALLVVEDATEILRGQRLLAWAEMARIIAHEIKNPLTPIRLSAEHMREVYRRDPEHFDQVFERCTTNILTQVDELRSIAAEFSAYSAIPRIDLKPGDLTAAVAGLVEGYRAAPPEGVAVDLETDGAIPVRFDAKLLGRAIRNLMENALRASAGGGRVTVKVERNDGQARVSVLDTGPGVAPDLLTRIFDPYFSTHDTGTGLGLPIARRIAEEHGGGIAARNRAEGGLEVTITLPVG